MKAIEQIMTSSPVIPVIVIEDINDAVPMAKALVAGGLSVLEVTLRTDCGLQAIANIKQEVAGAIVGAGTVITPQDVDKAVAAGAEFLVSPGSTPTLIDAALNTTIPLLPGVASPSEAMLLLEQGISHMKFFPAQAAGGIPMLKSIAGPLPQIKFCPTGGVSESNAPDFLALPNVLCVGGTWMLDAALVAARDWSAIEEKARNAAQLVSA
ncbi:bifunctional 4-hydroxy-2-oxoglutarate aldolase/2-dehydro-3-deoxy-phosphogluconate aldolase [Oceanicoccus sagamiensis]|uniref:2-dehydro-3-deoxy-phosphogluconate aldolase n=1 Tax=Oceanicoccus sagamiensis TaxID=716816 RepID=A0A1X9NAP2_9GAMM|nr:bifunctional 4-hydroxy-2-oxoglutarate aldolase/2-dehydro-3-deoxy-phosphogluconate aldolase [Oceanicoccus sagamiensis]ARN75108.1 keto-deoxy-phosphogluconate aldolase [Oceanicoccus sagamiensis]